MALNSLRYDAKVDVDETRQGLFIYGGQPSRFHEWEFRTLLEMETAGTDEKKRKELTAQVVKALRGDAYQIAMDMGRDALMAADGVKDLVKKVLDHAFPKQKSEAKDLYRAGHLVDGPLSRQRGESVVGFISRRRRWWIKLQAMDSTIQLSKDTLGELMLDSSRLGKVERLMVLTSTSNSTDFDAIATALTDQHPQIHKEEKRTDRDSGSWKSRKSAPRKPYRSHLGSSRQAFAAEQYRYGDSDLEEMAPAPYNTDPEQGLYGDDGTDPEQGLYRADEWDADEFHGFVAEIDESEPDEIDDDDEPGNEVEAELRAFTACIETGMTEKEVASVVQTEVVAFMAFNRVAGNPQGKGKGGGEG